MVRDTAVAHPSASLRTGSRRHSRLVLSLALSRTEEEAEGTGREELVSSHQSRFCSHAYHQEVDKSDNIEGGLCTC
jgi:hypothetical protein